MSDFGSSKIVKAASGLEIRKIFDDEWALIIHSAAASTKVTIMQRKGPTARTDIEVLYRLLGGVAEILGLHW